MPRRWKVVALGAEKAQAWYHLTFDEANSLLDLLRHSGVDASLEPQGELSVTSDETLHAPPGKPPILAISARR